MFSLAVKIAFIEGIIFTGHKAYMATVEVKQQTKGIIIRYSSIAPWRHSPFSNLGLEESNRKENTVNTFGDPKWASKTPNIINSK